MKSPVAAGPESLRGVCVGGGGGGGGVVAPAPPGRPASAADYLGGPPRKGKGARCRFSNCDGEDSVLFKRNTGLIS
jgi:hypothetical protein